MENGPPLSSLSAQASEVLPKCTPRPVPTLAGAFELNNVRSLLREWVTTISGKAMDKVSQSLGFNTNSSRFCPNNLSSFYLNKSKAKMENN